MATAGDHGRQDGRSGSLSRYFAEIAHSQPLSHEEELRLARQAATHPVGGVNRHLVERNLRFVVSIASEYRGLGVPFEDLISEGNLGLLHAAHRYDPSRGVRFITYAVWWVRKALLRALTNNTGVVRVPDYQQKKMRRLRQAEETLRRNLGRKPLREEIAEHMAGPVDQIEGLLRTTPREVSLDEPAGPDADRPIRDRIADPRSERPGEELLRGEDQRLIRSALATLTPRERQVIRDRFGLTGKRPMTLKEIGERLGVSRERIRQVEAESRRKLMRAILRQRRQR